MSHVGGCPLFRVQPPLEWLRDEIDEGQLLAEVRHYLFEPEFCIRTADRERGVVEKNVRDWRCLCRMVIS